PTSSVRRLVLTVARSLRLRLAGTACDIFGQPHPYERRRVQHRGTALPTLVSNHARPREPHSNSGLRGSAPRSGRFRSARPLSPLSAACRSRRLRRYSSSSITLSTNIKCSAVDVPLCRGLSLTTRLR